LLVRGFIWNLDLFLFDQKGWRLLQRVQQEPEGLSRGADLLPFLAIVIVAIPEGGIGCSAAGETTIVIGCCARAASGDDIAAALPSVMNSRRSIKTGISSRPGRRASSSSRMIAISLPTLR
jgi:hypothetical protein